MQHSSIRMSSDYATALEQFFFWLRCSADGATIREQIVLRREALAALDRAYAAARLHLDGFRRVGIRSDAEGGGRLTFFLWEQYAQARVGRSSGIPLSSVDRTKARIRERLEGVGAQVTTEELLRVHREVIKELKTEIRVLLSENRWLLAKAGQRRRRSDPESAGAARTATAKRRAS